MSKILKRKDLCKRSLLAGAPMLKYTSIRIPIMIATLRFRKPMHIFEQMNWKDLKMNTKICIGRRYYSKVYKYKDHYYDSHIELKKEDAHIRTDELERFKNEYQDLKNLDSPYIIRVFHYNESDAEYTMELADYTLEKYI